MIAACAFQSGKFQADSSGYYRKVCC